MAKIFLRWARRMPPDSPGYRRGSRTRGPLQMVPRVDQVRRLPRPWTSASCARTDQRLGRCGIRTIWSTENLKVDDEISIPPILTDLDEGDIPLVPAAELLCASGDHDARLGEIVKPLTRAGIKGAAD